MIGRFGLSEQEIRRRAMEWLDVCAAKGKLTFSYAELQVFTVGGERLALKDRFKGIRKPKEFRAALSITTTFRPSGAERPYDDGVYDENVLLRYKWDGTDPAAATNRSLREAMQQRAPLIWFVGIAKGLFQACYPVFIVGEEPQHHEFLVSAEAFSAPSADSAPVEHSRRYSDREVRQRLFQGIFRRDVLEAYDQRCAVCNLGHPQLLDAAHIVPDRDELGIASVVNGMALCKIHHAAFDVGILGIRPDLVVHIKPELLVEVDGPMLRHAFQEMHGQKLMSVPRSKPLQPRLDLLELAWDRFQSG